MHLVLLRDIIAVDDRVGASWMPSACSIDHRIHRHQRDNDSEPAGEWWTNSRPGSRHIKY